MRESDVVTTDGAVVVRDEPISVDDLTVEKFRGLGIAVAGFHDGVPRVKDLHLAEWLGFSRASKIRDLIKDVVRRGFLNDSEFFTVSVQNGERGRPATEYWLTEAGALFVAARTDLPKGAQLLKLLVAAFLEAQEAHHRPIQFTRTLRELDERSEWEEFWSRETIVAICKLHRWPTHGPTGAMYQPLARVIDGLYRLLLGDDLVNELKRRNPNPLKGSNHHQLLRDKARELVGDDLRLVKIFADQSATPREWWGRLRLHFKREPLQLGLADQRAKKGRGPLGLLHA